MQITIVGLGPGHPDLLTRKAWQTLHDAAEVYFRTAVHPGLTSLPIRHHHSFDTYYEQATDFDSLYEQIAAQIITLGQRDEGVVYAVPGHPLIGETTVTHILQQARAANIPVTIIDGLSFIEPTLAALGIDGLSGLQLYDAIDITRMHHPPINPDKPALLAQLYSLSVASDVKLTLSNQYPDDHPITLVHGAGTAEQSLEQIPLYALDHSRQINHLTSLYIAPLAQAGSFERFQEIMAHLRAPEGCPWDQKQTHLTLRKYLLEETYEVLEALDNEDMAAVQEELGDLLLQIVFHAQIATEAGEFQMMNVLQHVIAKMIHRHPHVWGDVVVNTESQLLANWEMLKRKEKAARGETAQPTSVFDGVPKGLPALAQAAAFHERAAKTGFDWPNVEGMYDKLREEVDEMRAAKDEEHRAEELGDVLAVVVNLARYYKIDPEIAMRQSNQKFARRFRYVEQHTTRSLTELSLDEWDELWRQAKAAEEHE